MPAEEHLDGVAREEPPFEEGEGRAEERTAKVHGDAGDRAEGRAADDGEERAGHPRRERQAVEPHEGRGSPRRAPLLGERARGPPERRTDGSDLGEDDAAGDDGDEETQTRSRMAGHSSEDRFPRAPRKTEDYDRWALWPLWRLLRASFAFSRIFWSYLYQLALERLFGRRRAWLSARWERLHRRNAQRLYRAIISLRGVFIKMGQVLSIMGTFLPRAYAEELEGLQDQVPPRPWRDMKKSFVAALGRRPEEVFARFSEEPLAAASLGQVHRATLKDGADVAVKLLYPDIETIIRIDLRVLRGAMLVYAWFVPVRALASVIDQLEDLLARETDYLNEGRCMDRMARNFAGDPDILFPAVTWDLTRKSVLVMTFMEGIKISRKDELIAAGIDPEAVARKLVESFYKQLFIDGFFHADPHPGNFLVRPGPRIVILDFGAATETKPNLVGGMLSILRGLFAREDALVIQGIETMGFVAQDGDRELLYRTVRAYFQKLLDLDIRDFGKIDASVARKFADPGVKRTELRELMKSVVYPDGWFYVERASLILFGLSAQLAPRMNTIAVGFPYLMKMMSPPVEAPRTP